MATSMQMQMQAKLAVLILVVAVVAETGNGLCDYHLEVQTTFGTRSNVIFHVSDKIGAGWTETVPGNTGKFVSGELSTSVVRQKMCVDPCQLILEVEDAGAEWLPLAVRLIIKEDNAVKQRRTFPVLKVVRGGGLARVNWCRDK